MRVAGRGAMRMVGDGAETWFHVEDALEGTTQAFAVDYGHAVAWLEHCRVDQNGSLG